MAKIEDALANFGLTQNETKVYIALLELGSTTTGALISRTGLHVPRVYDALRGLIHKGLASFVIKNKRKHFEAAGPEHFLELLNDKEREINDALPELKKLERMAGPQLEAATIYKGKKGLRTVLESILSELEGGREYLDFGVSGIFRQVMPIYWDRWQEMKKKKRVRSRVIFDEKLRGSQLVKDYFGQYKFVPSRYFCPSDTMVYEDKIAIFIWTADPPTVVLIRDEKTAMGYKNIFEWMWSKANK
jgi:predicted transcriptional regulator